MKKRFHSSAFTLIEILVVITIVAVLAGLSFPAIRTAMLKGRQAEATQRVSQVGKALLMYANDNDGVFPRDKNSFGEPIQSSNDAFRSLFPNYLDTEQVFVLGRSVAGPRADDRCEKANEILQSGENHWAYVEGLTNTSKSTWPLVVDHTDGAGMYKTRDSELGGIWTGQSAIVVRVDGGVAVTPLQGTGEKRFLPRRENPSSNALAVDKYMGANVRLREPTN